MSKCRDPEAHKPAVIVQWPEYGNDDADPRKEATQQSSNDRPPIPAAIVGVSAIGAIQVTQRQTLSPHQPVVNNQHRGNGAHAPGITHQPSVDVPRRVFKQAPGLYQYANDASNQSAGA